VRESISPAELRYVEAIDLERGDGAPVSVGALARRLGLSPASVSEMLDRLAADGLVRRGARGVALLTADGDRTAREIAGRRALVERFLRDVLVVPPDQVPAEAERLVAVVSPNLEARMQRALEERR
jgi:DtxR family Mn-dependent transcriptional regulator